MFKFIVNLFKTRLSDDKKEMMMKLIELLDGCEVPRDVQDRLLTKALKLKDDELSDLIYEFSNLTIAKSQLQKTSKELDDLCFKKSQEINKKFVNEVYKIRKEVENELNNFK